MSNINDLIELKPVNKEEAGCLHKLQVEAFLPLYEKYHDDDISPAKESVETVEGKITDVNSDYYFILLEGQPVGGVRVKWHNGSTVHKNYNWISPIYVVPKFQNRGIATCVIEKLFDIYSDTIEWHLATIKQEKGNCHLYEKVGFVAEGEEIKVNDKMTLIKYVKINN